MAGKFAKEATRPSGVMTLKALFEMYERERTPQKARVRRRSMSVTGTAMSRDVGRVRSHCQVAKANESEPASSNRTSSSCKPC